MSQGEGRGETRVRGCEVKGREACVLVSGRGKEGEGDKREVHRKE